MKHFLSAKQAAEILDCSPDHILESRKRGVIKGYRYKKRLWRFRREDVEKPASGKGTDSGKHREGADRVVPTVRPTHDCMVPR